MEKEQKNKIFRAAIFFDGTGNNRVNSFKNPTKHGNRTNINTLYESCSIKEKLYIEGIGTKDNEEDSNWAKATGANPFGYTGYSYDDKLEKGLVFLKVYHKLHSTNDIELFVYGFSRGATLARDFAKRALASYPNVKIKVLGIFDTVVSLPFQRPNIHFTEREMEKISRILHLTAINETRKFFPLTSIQSNTGQDSLVKIKNFDTDKVKEIFVPGAHADVGGGYNEGEQKVYLNQMPKSEKDLEKYLERIKNTVRDDFSGNTPFPIWNNLLNTNVEFVGGAFFLSNVISSRQKVLIEMSRVYFEIMAEYTNKYVNEAFFNFSSHITLPSLIKLYEDLDRYLHRNTPTKGPNYDYFNLVDFTHVSSNYGKVESSRSQGNELLNTFDPRLLSIELQNIRRQHPMENLEWMSESRIYGPFGLDVLFVNMPSNDEWHREVLFE